MLAIERILADEANLFELVKNLKTDVIKMELLKSLNEVKD